MKKTEKKNLFKEINTLTDFFKNHKLPYGVVSIQGYCYDDYYLELKINHKTISFIYFSDLDEPIGLYKADGDLFCLIIHSVHICCDEVVISCK